MKDTDTNIEKTKEYYSNYIKNKEIINNIIFNIIIIGGSLLLTLSAIGVETALGITILGGIIFSEESVKKKCKKELLQAISVDKLDNTKFPIKKLQEKLTKASAVTKLSKHLRETFLKGKIYSENINFNSQKLDGINEESFAMIV